jgi:hypothetical protein
MSGAPDAPGVRLGNADHRGRTRRVESARAVSSFAVRGTVRIAPATEPARPALLERREPEFSESRFKDSRIRDSRIQGSGIQGFKDLGFAISDQ